MKTAIKKGFGFGLTSGIITTLGIIVGLDSTTHSATVVVGGILVIALADAMSDALGIHISEESENQHTRGEIWTATIATFFSKFVFALTFVAPVVFFPLNLAVIVSIVWGALLLTLFSYHLAYVQRVSPYRVIGEHLTIAALVIIITRYIGDLVSALGL